MADLKSYSGKEVSVIVGAFPISGYADGDFVTVAYTSDAYTKITGADDLTTRSKTGDSSGEITITLQQTSESNAVLSALALADRLGAGVGTILIRDTNGLDIHTSTQAWIRKMPDATYGKESGDRVWIFDCVGLESFVGGN